MAFWNTSVIQHGVVMRTYTASHKGLHDGRAGAEGQCNGGPEMDGVAEGDALLLRERLKVIGDLVDARVCRYSQ